MHPIRGRRNCIVKRYGYIHLDPYLVPGGHPDVTADRLLICQADTKALIEPFTVSRIESVSPVATRALRMLSKG